MGTGKTKVKKKNQELRVGVAAVGRTYLAGLSFPLRRAHALEAVLQVQAGSTLGAGG